MVSFLLCGIQVSLNKSGQAALRPRKVPQVNGILRGDDKKGFAEDWVMVIYGSWCSPCFPKGWTESWNGPVDLIGKETFVIPALAEAESPVSCHRI